jgi:hypothetical protein
MKKVTFVPRPWPDLVLPKPENEVYILVKKVGQKRQKVIILDIAGIVDQVLVLDGWISNVGRG